MDDKLPELKDLVGLLMDSITKSKETFVSREDVYPTLLRTKNEIHEAVEKGEVDVFMFASLCRFPIYQVDFGWGKPVWVSRVHAPYEATFLFDAEDGDGIEAWVSFRLQQTRHASLPSRYCHFGLHLQTQSSYIKNSSFHLFQYLLF